MIILGSALFYFYREIAFRILALIWLFTGFWVWVGGREAYHIGASGIVYGLAAFILVSGILRRHTGLMAMALVVVFLYGSLIWGIFPEFFPQENISWEAHLFGLVAGISLAFFYRKEGPQRKLYEWELEEDEDDEEEEKRGQGEEGKGSDDAYWNTTLTDEEIKEIRHIYKKRS
jgi:membrane associated rhomboid family serine protease